MKRASRAIASGLVLALIVTTVACSNNDDAALSGTGASAGSAAGPSSTAAPGSTAADSPGTSAPADPGTTAARAAATSGSGGAALPSAPHPHWRGRRAQAACRHWPSPSSRLSVISTRLRPACTWRG